MNDEISLLKIFLKEVISELKIRRDDPTINAIKKIFSQLGIKFSTSSKIFYDPVDDFINNIELSSKKKLSDDARKKIVSFAASVLEKSLKSNKKLPEAIEDVKAALKTNFSYLRHV